MVSAMPKKEHPDSSRADRGDDPLGGEPIDRSSVRHGVGSQSGAMLLPNQELFSVVALRATHLYYH